jgi:hypothetical protein
MENPSRKVYDASSGDIGCQGDEDWRVAGKQETYYDSHA